MEEPVLTPLFRNLIVERRTTDEEEIRAYFGRLHGGSDASGPEQRAVEAEADRRVALVLEVAGPGVAEVLGQCFDTEVPAELEVYGLLAHLIAMLPEATDAYEMSGTNLDLTSWLGRLPKRSRTDLEARWLLETLVSEATRMFVDAVLAYREGKRLLGVGCR